jgi:hypothetical protein
MGAKPITVVVDSLAKLREESKGYTSQAGIPGAWVREGVRPVPSHRRGWLKKQKARTSSVRAFGE